MKKPKKRKLLLKSKSQRNNLIKRNIIRKIKKSIEIEEELNFFIFIKFTFIIFLIIIFFYFYSNKPKTKNFDPIRIFESRFNNTPIEICNEENTKHICYTNKQGYYSDILEHKNGTICISENIVIEPTKGKLSGLVYKGPVDRNNYGYPLLSKRIF